MIKLDSKQMIKNVDKYYSFVVCYHLNDNKEIVLQDSHKGKCRFCGKGQPNVTFEKVAHAIPPMFKLEVQFVKSVNCTFK